MKFLYEYRTSDNVRHEGVVAAADREDAFAILKAKGIRPGVVREAPGFFNKLFGKGKRWLAIGVLGVLCVVFGVLFCRSARISNDVQTFQTSQIRRQVIGDSAIIERGIKTGWSDVFSREGDRFLASFAIPGVPAGQRSTTEDELRSVIGVDVVFADDDTMESRQIKSMVQGLKVTIRGLVDEGWTMMEVGRALVNRQEQEIAYFERAKAEIEKAKDAGMEDDEVLALWEQRNESLRKMGIRLVSMPD